VGNTAKFTACVCGLMLLFVSLSVAATVTIEAKPFRVLTENAPPFSFKDQNDRVDGLVTQVVIALLKKMDLSVDIEVLPWVRAYKTALVEPNILIYSIVRIPEREASFHWLTPVIPVDIGVYSMPGELAMPLTDLDQLNNMTIGVMRGSSSIRFLKNIRNISDDNLIEMASFGQLYKMLQFKRVNYVLAPDLLVKYLDQQYQTPEQQRPVAVYHLPIQQQSTMHLALSKKTPQGTVQKFRQAIAEMHATGQIEQIVEQYKQQLSQ
jgi:polar amino acid transport system substrate-binding protein